MTESKPNQSDKRRFDRLKAYCLIRYSKMGDSNHPEGKTSNVKNISEGGLLFTSYEPIPISSTIKVLINLPGRDKPLESYAKVMRCIKATPADEVYHVGVAFLDISEQDRKEISSHLELAIHDKYGRKLVDKQRWWQFWKWRKKKFKIIPNTKDAFFTTGGNSPDTNPD